MSTYREAISERRMADLRAALKPGEKAAPPPVKTDAELIAEAASWEIEPSPELIASVAEREARIKGEI